MKKQFCEQRNFETYTATYLGGHTSLCGAYPILYLYIYIYIYPRVIQSGQVARTTQSVQTLGDSSCNFSLSTGLSTTYWECYRLFSTDSCYSFEQGQVGSVGSAFNQKKQKTWLTPKNFMSRSWPQPCLCHGRGWCPPGRKSPPDGSTDLTERCFCWDLWHRDTEVIYKMQGNPQPQLLAGLVFFR